MSHLYRIIAITIALLSVALLSHNGQAAPPAATPITSEVWRLGVTSEGDAADAALIGRPASITASFRSNRGVQDIFFTFPASAQTQTVQSAAYRLLQRSGTYTSTASLALEVRDASGMLQHTVSAESIDLQTATMDTWASLVLTTDLADLAIAPGEHLVAHFTLAGAPAGTLDVRPVFEIVATSDPTVSPPTTPTPTPPILHLPLIVR